MQCEIQARIERARKNYAKSPKDRITEQYVSARLESLESMWSDFGAGHKKLMEKHYTLLMSSSYVSDEVYDCTHDLYLDYKVELKTAAQKCASSNISNKQSNDNQLSTNNTVTKHNAVKLPKIVIPTFSGKYTEWVTFRDLFESLVHNNDTIDNVQKMHYLKGYLTGEAELLLRQIPISNSNYVKCWDCLKERYNNKRFICQTILKRFLSQKSSTCESANFLKELIDTSTDCLNALTNIGIDVSTWDVMVIHLLTLKLDPETRKQWELAASSTAGADVLPSFTQFREFIINRFRALEFIETKKIVYHTNAAPAVQKPRTLHVSQGSQCPLCSEFHKIIFCKQFAKLDLDARRDFVQTKGLCFNCLGGFHSARVCQNPTTCRVCKRRHHSLLHPTSGSVTSAVPPKVGGESVSNVGTFAEESEATEETSDSESVTACFSSGNSDQVLLATALVSAQSKNGQYYTVRALLDQGSQASFVTEATVQYLGLKKKSIQGNISALGGENNVRSKSIVTLNLQSLVYPEVTLSLKAYVLRSITTLLPVKKVVDFTSINISEIPLADPSYHTPNKIDVLLGADVYSQIIQEGIKKNTQGNCVAQATSLGWVLSGIVHSNHKQCHIAVLHTVLTEDDQLKKFWELESDSSATRRKNLFTDEEKRCEEIFAATTTRDTDGRYVVKLPFKDDDPRCKYGGSLKIAENRFYGLEKRLYRNMEFKTKYQDVIHEYLRLGHMEEVPAKNKIKSDAVYLPQLAVVRQNKDTTQLRAVFDASCKGHNGISLNDDLMVGPTLQQDLRHLVLRWRSYPICLVADIVKMYRQVKVREEDADFQRILWRDTVESELQHFRLLRVTFGTASAPYLAVKALQQAALDEGHNYPLAAQRVLKDFYMDDLMTGCFTSDEAFLIYKEMNELLGKAGFPLQKWSTNSDTLLKKIKDDQHNKETGAEIRIKQDEIIKILGLTWNRECDDFQYAVTLPALKIPVTKRNIISDIARLFDPLGWVAPTVIIAKVMIQKLWLIGINWDEEVPRNLLQEWCTYRDELSTLSNVRVPRWMGLQQSNKTLELHGFSDASKTAYAAVVYIRVVDEADNITVALVTAKTKVAPIKQVSIPRLELCGAVLLARLLDEVSELLNVFKGNIHAWTDSMVVLAWLNSHPNKWQTFVANRVSEILTTLDSSQWSHVPSKLNPADYASRGLRPQELLNTSMWFEGPDFLKQVSITYNRLKEIETNLEAAKVHHAATIACNIWERFSSLTRMTRVIAYCKRFLNMKKPKTERYNKDFLTSDELTEALNVCIRQCQIEAFEQEYKLLEKEVKHMPRESHLKTLNPFLDNRKIMRVGGRLENSSHLSYDRKHPIILPKIATLSRLIVADAHLKTFHGSPQLMQNYINSKYWILRSKELIKSCYRKCVICIRHNATQKTQLMGQLPAARATPTRPFKFCGVDYAGPINLRTSGGRGHKSFKGYICLFVCMSTRAVHIEVVSSLTTEGFLQAFRRMVARRGHCQEIWSDHGTNFVGASRELVTLFDSEKSSLSTEVAEALATNGTKWHLIPPHAPNFGGLWEAAIKSAKYHLKRVVGNSTLTYEEMSTVLSQIEACLNSRPLCRIGNDPNEVHVLTPGHLLVGEPLVTVPDHDFLDTTMTTLRRWQLTRRMIQDFWRQWSQEYLTRFLHRYKWAQQVPEPNVGDVVLIKEDDLPPSRWLIGTVELKHPGPDNITRVVTLRTKGSLIKRPTSKICVLPISE